MDNKLTAKSLFDKDEVKARFQQLLGKRSSSFITSVLQIVASNDMLIRAEASSVYHAAAVAATLDLPLNNALGFAYIVPYNQSVKVNDQWQKKVVAQFQIGNKGFKQLALRSGQFRIMNATDVRVGEIKSNNRLTGNIEFEWMLNEEQRRKLPVEGYVSYFELLNGFSNTFYMSMETLQEHGKKYSQTYKNNKGLWVDDFHSMAMKTVSKLNLSKNAPLSIEMQKAIVFDQSVINDEETMQVTYVDNESGQLAEAITVDELRQLLDVKHQFLSQQEFEDATRIIDNDETKSFKKLHTFLIAKQ